MLRLIFKSIGWLINHTALFLLILILLIVGQSILFIQSNWILITSDPVTENPIESLSKEIEGTIPTFDQSVLCKDQEAVSTSERKRLDQVHNQQTSRYKELYFYQINEKIKIELELIKIESEMRLLDQAILYLKHCQDLADIEDTRKQCDQWKGRCIRLIRECQDLEISSSNECSTLERFIPPWPDICESQKIKINECNQSREFACSRSSTICELINQSEIKPLESFNPATKVKLQNGTVIHFLSGMTKVSDEFIGQSLKAFLILLSIIFSPLLVNILVFFVLARLAENAYRIRFSKSIDMSIVELKKATDVLEIEIDSDKELIVKPEYIRNVSEDTHAKTQFFVSGSFPITSLAAGLYMLTRFTSTTHSTAVSLSETKDSEIKLSLVRLNEDDEIVISPRHIVGVLQAKDKPLKITSHWLLNSPHAWLSGQLRVLVLSGPAEIIIKGGRGVFAQEIVSDVAYQCEGVVGYTTNLLVQPRRTETFWAFHRNQRDLFKHRFSAANGIVLLETHPQRKLVNLSGWSLQRLGDLILNVFGI